MTQYQTCQWLECAPALWINDIVKLLRLCNESSPMWYGTLAARRRKMKGWQRR